MGDTLFIGVEPLTVLNGELVPEFTHSQNKSPILVLDLGVIFLLVKKRSQKAIGIVQRKNIDTLSTQENTVNQNGVNRISRGLD